MLIGEVERLEAERTILSGTYIDIKIYNRLQAELARVKKELREYEEEPTL